MSAGEIAVITVSVDQRTNLMARFGSRIFKRFRISTRVIAGKRGARIKAVTPGIPSRRIKRGK